MGSTAYCDYRTTRVVVSHRLGPSNPWLQPFKSIHCCRWLDNSSKANTISIRKKSCMFFFLIMFSKHMICNQALWYTNENVLNQKKEGIWRMEHVHDWQRKVTRRGRPKRILKLGWELLCHKGVILGIGFRVTNQISLWGEQSLNSIVFLFLFHPC